MHFLTKAHDPARQALCAVFVYCIDPPVFDDLPCLGQGTLEETTSTAIKRVLAFRLAAAMEEQKISKVEMAKRLETSRSQLDRLLDPTNDAVHLGTLARAAKAVGRNLRVELRWNEI